ncbi:iron complex transport system substrate-binding protein [Gammaproteobacteria bacterium]
MIERAIGVLSFPVVMGLLAIGLVMSVRGEVIEVTDATGEKVDLPVAARRIASLSPHLTELLYAAGAGVAVVGVAEHSDYPPAARRLPVVGGTGKVDAEQVLALHPDLVVAWGSGIPTTQIERLRRLGLVVYVSEPRALTDIALELERLGQLAGTEAVAKAAALTFLTRLTELRVRYASRPQVRVFYQVWDHPLVTVGSEHLISRIIDLCGGRNVFAESSNLAPTISREAVLAANPEVIVASGVDAHRPAWLEDWHSWPQLIAVDRNNLFDIPPDLIQRHTSRILEGAGLLCAALETARERR